MITKLRTTVSDRLPKGAVNSISSPDLIKAVIEQILVGLLELHPTATEEPFFFVEPPVVALPREWVSVETGGRQFGCEARLTLEGEAGWEDSKSLFSQAAAAIGTIYGDALAPNLELKDSVTLLVAVDSGMGEQPAYFRTTVYGKIDPQARVMGVGIIGRLGNEPRT